MKQRYLSIRVDEETYRLLHTKLAMKDLTLKTWLTKIIEKFVK